MAPEKAMPAHETLDPEDWESMRALGHRMLDDMLNYIKTVLVREVVRIGNVLARPIQTARL